MNNVIKDKISKVLELTNRGVEGEKEAAKIALERLMKKYNVSDEELEKIHLKRYVFKYKTQLDINLFVQLISFFLKIKNCKLGKLHGAKNWILNWNIWTGLHWTVPMSISEDMQLHNLKNFVCLSSKNVEQQKQKMLKESNCKTLFSPSM